MRRKVWPCGFPQSPEHVIAAIREFGSDARDLRDAAHEAVHALDAEIIPGFWNRETIHSGLMRKGKPFAIASEIKARAVEQIVCRDFGIDPGSIESWALIACMEALKGSGIDLPGVPWFVEQVQRVMNTRQARKMANRVLALGSENP